MGKVSIPKDPLIFRIIHKDNLDYMLQSGKLVTSSHPDHDPNYKPIGETTLIQSRKAKPIIIGGKNCGTLGDYIPFFFGQRPVMLYAIQEGYYVQKLPPQEIVYIVSSLDKLKQFRCKYLFTDGHAYTELSQFFDNDADLNNIDWSTVYSNKWNNTPSDPDRKRRKQAECLIKYEIPIDALIFFVVYNKSCKSFVDNLLITNGRFQKLTY
ncbi:MAG: DUF4433 domain-containing protein [Bacteroidota bacterium]|nr:DUF4433 domain-containing protein [Bacteroidota bacterium]